MSKEAQARPAAKNEASQPLLSGLKSNFSKPSEEKKEASSLATPPPAKPVIDKALQGLGPSGGLATSAGLRGASSVQALVKGRQQGGVEGGVRQAGGAAGLTAAALDGAKAGLDKLKALPTASKVFDAGAKVLAPVSATVGGALGTAGAGSRGLEAIRNGDGVGAATNLTSAAGGAAETVGGAKILANNAGSVLKNVAADGLKGLSSSVAAAPAGAVKLALRGSGVFTAGQGINDLVKGYQSGNVAQGISGGLKTAAGVASFVPGGFLVGAGLYGASLGVDYFQNGINKFFGK